MNYVIIFNGLGNQMSQYAFYLAKRQYDSKCKLLIINNPNSHNGYELDKVFNIKNQEKLLDKIIRWCYIQLYNRSSFIQKILNYLCFRVIHEPKNYDYTPILLEDRKNGINLYHGGWHTEKYFHSIETEIRDVFTFSDISLNSQAQEDKEYLNILREIKSNNNSISLHVRRGDYLNIKPNDYWQLGGVATEEYYHKCIDYIQKHVTNPHFYIFSNDIEWCQNNFKLKNVTFITCNQGKKSWRDLHLMSECRHHIIANSTFSWWGAWLSPYKSGITLHPRWFIRNVETKDFYPEKWICIQ